MSDEKEVRRGKDQYTYNEGHSHHEGGNARAGAGARNVEDDPKDLHGPEVYTRHWVYFQRHVLECNVDGLNNGGINVEVENHVSSNICRDE